MQEIDKIRLKQLPQSLPYYTILFQDITICLFSGKCKYMTITSSSQKQQLVSTFQDISTHHYKNPHTWFTCLLGPLYT